MEVKGYLIFLIFPILLYSAVWLIPSFSVVPFAFFSIQPQPGGWYYFTYVGFKNIADVLTTGRFYEALRNNFIFTFFIVFARNFFALLIAVIFFESRIKGARYFNTLIFLPMALSSYMLGFLFRFIFNPAGGLFVRIDPSLRGFLAPEMIPYTVAGIDLWRSFGFPMVTILAGLTSIPQEVLESASLDGAVGLKRVRYVTGPLLKPVITVLLTLSFIGSFGVFDTWAGIVGTSSQCQVISTFIYFTAFFTSSGFGIAAAMSVILLLIELAVFLIYFYQLGMFGKRTEE